MFKNKHSLPALSGFSIHQNLKGSNNPLAALLLLHDEDTPIYKSKSPMICYRDAPGNYKSPITYIIYELYVRLGR